MSEIVIILITLIVFSNILLIIAYLKIKKEETTNFNELKISVIVPFKNEENKLPDLLKSLIGIDYPTDTYEIIFVDDNSNDKSEEIIKSFSLVNSRLIKATDKKILGKKGALEIGIQKAQYDIIAITDADCIVEKDWLKSISNKISQGYDLVFGYSPLIKKKLLISKISSYENLKNFILYFTSVELSFPFGATARSLAFKKSAYLKVNGYKNTTETLSGDDDLLIREFVKKNFKVGYFLDKNSLVYSYPSDSFKDYLLRKSRHVKTSHHYLIKHKIILGIWYFINFLSFFSFFLAVISFYFIAPLAIKIISDLFLQYLFRNKIKHDFNIIEIVYLEFFYQIFLVINFITSLAFKDNWNKSKSFN
jgi:glycosyltransferase involved in cell wall biosynthesis